MLLIIVSFITKFRLSIGQKGFRSEVFLLHDNVKHHTTAVTQRKLANRYWAVLDHPPDISDLSPCDFHMFELLKEAHGKQRFTTSEEVQSIFKRTVRAVQYASAKFYDTGIKKLPDRWKMCINKMGNYVEKLDKCNLEFILKNIWFFVKCSFISDPPSYYSKWDYVFGIYDLYEEHILAHTSCLYTQWGWNIRYKKNEVKCYDKIS